MADRYVVWKCLGLSFRILMCNRPMHLFVVRLHSARNSKFRRTGDSGQRLLSSLMRIGSVLTRVRSTCVNGKLDGAVRGVGSAS